MTATEELLLAIRNGVHRVGEIEIEANASSSRFRLFHHLDAELVKEPVHDRLEIFHGPAEARQISLYAADGTYRFLKAQRNLRRGWLMMLDSPADLRLALDQFYPAALGLWLAHRRGTLEVEDLRHKLSRQTGMYRRAQLLSDDGAQALVPATCAAAPGCARRILWGISPTLPLQPSPASECTGIGDDVAESAAIPLLCAAPCSHFIAECREAAKKQA
jgi:hypothetical protein